MRKIIKEFGGLVDDVSDQLGTDDEVSVDLTSEDVEVLQEIRDFVEDIAEKF